MWNEFYDTLFVKKLPVCYKPTLMYLVLFISYVLGKYCGSVTKRNQIVRKETDRYVYVDKI